MIQKNNVVFNPLIRLEKPMGFLDYIKLQMNALCVLSDSGTISEETAILKLKSLNIREAHERPEAMELGTVIMTGLDIDRVMQSLEVVLSHDENSNITNNTVYDYSFKHVSETVVKVILSYIDYVKVTV